MWKDYYLIQFNFREGWMSKASVLMKRKRSKLHLRWFHFDISSLAMKCLPPPNLWKIQNFWKTCFIFQSNSDNKALSRQSANPIIFEKIKGEVVVHCSIIRCNGCGFLSLDFSFLQKSAIVRENIRRRFSLNSNGGFSPLTSEPPGGDVKKCLKNRSFHYFSFVFIELMTNYQ